jgi:fatty acid desaturase
MDIQMRNLLAGGAAFVVAGVVALIVGAPGVLCLLMIVTGMVMLGLFSTGHETLPAFFEARRVNRRRPVRPSRRSSADDEPRG